MATMILDPQLAESLIRQRRDWGSDRHDEVWEGVYMMAPLPNNEHQEIVSGLVAILQDVVGWAGLGKVFPGVNLTAFEGQWEHNFRAPDVVAFLRDTAAKDCDTHWRGAADFLVEIISPGDRTREKIPFYSSLGVRELLLVDREPWTLELYRWQEGQLTKVGQCSPGSDAVLQSRSVPLEFRLLAAEPRPKMEVTHPATGRRWLI
jgi:Uma2 family endonuclease